MARHKKQHYIPACYLKAWCDSSAPRRQTPYGWVFEADGSNPRRKAPENIFHETDMYTIRIEGVGRDLHLVHGLHELETKFARIRKKKLEPQQLLDETEHILLCAFIAAMGRRTPAWREHIRKQWERPLRMIEKMNEWLKTATPEEISQAAAISPFKSSDESGLTYENVKEIHENPIQTMMGATISTLAPLLMKLDFALLTAHKDKAFITSDHPCVWLDPEGYKRPPLYSSPALGYRTIEITLPISPHQIVWLNRKGMKGYLDANSAIVDELNRRTRCHADKYFVTDRNETNPLWFDPGIEPDDSWYKTHGQRVREEDGSQRFEGNQGNCGVPLGSRRTSAASKTP